VKNRFQNLPFKCNLQRYIAARTARCHALYQTLADIVFAINVSGGRGGGRAVTLNPKP
jgi:hypothetical protein